MNEALGRLRRRRPQVEWDAAGEERLQAEIIRFPVASTTPDPEQTMAHREIQTLIEQSIDALPDAFRTVFVARMVEGMSVEETAAMLKLRPETVKTRLHRARARIREDLDRKLGPMVTSAFPFDGARCTRMTEAVIRRLRLPPGNLS
jgi:RNA polymerase sigma-70 factor (ECF subfamily)